MSINTGKGNATMLTRRTALAGLAAAPLLPRRARARAQAAPAMRIGILQDASGTYSYLGGQGSVACARQAAAEMAGSHGIQAEFVLADHQNKTDIGLGIARQWLEQGVDPLMEFNNSAIALAVNTLVRDRDRVMLANNVGSAALSGPACTPNMTHWTFDTAMLARTVGGALSAQGGQSWTTCSARRCATTPPRSWRPRVAGCWERLRCRLARRTSPPRCCRRSRPGRTWSGWRWRAGTC